MTKNHDLADLSKITGAMFQAEQAKLNELNQKENKLRRALTKLEQNRKTSLSLPSNELHTARQIGADILWQGWIGRNKEELNRQLALCLVEKAAAMKALRRAFGRDHATQSLKVRHQADQRLDTRRKEVEELNRLKLLQHKSK